jgi:Na+/citrate or Na+/malate symporter
MQFDPIDAALTIAMMVAGFIMTGIASFNLFGVDFSATVVTLGGYAITTAYAVSVLAFAGIVATNDNTSFQTLKDDAQNLDDYYAYAILGTVALFAAWILVPDVASFFQSGDLWGVLYVAVTTTAGFAVGWML